VEQVLVETGVYSEGWVEVRGDLYPGDRVVVRGQGNLLDGGAVSVRNRDGRPVDPNRVAAPVSSLASGVDG
jgi:multidrug efflux pump subunit AcrA (membrane-fusion protein)